MKILITTIFSSILTMLVVFSSCSSELDKRIEMIGKAGERTIDWTLLNRSYHLEPKWGKGLSYKQAYENQLNYLVDQKLFAQAAISKSLDKDIDIEKYLTFIKEKEMIKELYRREVESQIEITEEEYKSAYRKLKSKIRLAYITTPYEESAEKYLNMFQTTSINELILFDPISEEKGVTPFFSFGEMTDEIDDVAFDLDLNEVAGPLKIEKKYMIIKLIDGSREKIFSDADLTENKSKIKQIIFERKAAKLSTQYIYQLLKDEEVKLNPDIFLVLVEHFNAIVQREDDADPMPVNLTDSELVQVQTTIKDLKDDVLVTYGQGQMTVQQFVSSLSSMPAGIRPMVKMSQNLKLAVGIIVRNKYLAEKAYAENLDTDERVFFETQWQSDQFLARHWLSNLRAQISLNPDEISSFMTSNDYLRIQQRSKKELSPEQIEDLLIDFKFTEAKMRSADSLRELYEVEIESTKLLSNIKSPDAIINENPIKLFYREKFN
jgi:hypothetical protein